MTHQPDLRRVSARPIQIIAATKVVNEDTGEPMIAVGIGESIEQSEFLVMSIRDARSLRFSLGGGASAPCALSETTLGTLADRRGIYQWSLDIYSPA
mgnify:FL=1